MQGEVWKYRDEQVGEEGLIFKAHKLVIPASQKHKFLKDSHVGHLGQEKTLIRVREYIYQPGITRNIKEYIKGCNICQLIKLSQCKEPLIPHTVPSKPWAVGIDIFYYGSCKYLLVADYFSKFLLIRVLNNPMATHVMNILKIMFSEHGIPAHTSMDQGRQLTSAEFCEFAKCYRFEVLHSTLKCP